MTSKVFISYRRASDSGNAVGIHVMLEAEFGAERLFMDVQGLSGGQIFADVLQRELDASDVLLAIISRDWVTGKKTDGSRRLDDPKDWVRHEVGYALRSGKRVIPVLVDGAEVPRQSDLPEDLKPLAGRHVHRVNHDKFKSDCKLLALQVRIALVEMERERAATAAEREAAEARRKEEEEIRAVEQARQEAERARGKQDDAGITPEQIQRALEVENWLLVKDRGNEAELRDHIARHRGGVTESVAMELLAQVAWLSTAQNDKKSLMNYIAEFPNSHNTKQANTTLTAIDQKQREEQRRLAARKADVVHAQEIASMAREEAQSTESIEQFEKLWSGTPPAVGRLSRQDNQSWKNSARALLRRVWYGRNRVRRTFFGHQSMVSSVAMCSNGRLGLSGGEDGTLCLWGLTEGKQLNQLRTHSASISCSSFAPNGSKVLTGASDGQLTLWDCGTGAELAHWKLTSRISSICFDSKGQRAIVGAEYAGVVILDLQSGSETRPWLFGGSKKVVAVSFAGNDRRIAVVDAEGHLRTLALGTHDSTQVYSTPSVVKSATAELRTASFTRDGSRCLAFGAEWAPTGSKGFYIHWDTARKRVINETASVESRICSLALLPRGGYFVAVVTKKTIMDHNRLTRVHSTLELRNVRNGRLIKTLNRPCDFQEAMTSMAISGDGRTALTGGDGGVVKHWDLN